MTTTTGSKVTIHMVASLDGYIVDKAGGVAWLERLAGLARTLNRLLQATFKSLRELHIQIAWLANWIAAPAARGIGSDQRFLSAPSSTGC